MNKEMEKNNTSVQVKWKLKKLKDIITIINTNENPEEKAYEIYKIYHPNTVELFKKTYSGFDIFERNDPNLAEYVINFTTICAVLETYEARGYFKNARAKYLEEEQYRKYEQPVEVVSDFVNSMFGYSLDNFLKMRNISMTKFNKCVKVVKKTDLNLYKRYEAKLKMLSMAAVDKNRNILFNIVYGIKNGYFLDGAKFSNLEFWKRIPSIFINNSSDNEFALFEEAYKTSTDEENDNEKVKKKFGGKTISSKISNFAKVVLAPKDVAILMLYLKNNNFLQATPVTELGIRNKYGTGFKKFMKYETDAEGNKTFIQNVIINDDDVLNMIEYMRINKLPFIYEVFLLVEEKYKNGEIDKETLKDIDVENGYSKIRNR